MMCYADRKSPRSFPPPSSPPQHTAHPSPFSFPCCAGFPLLLFDPVHSTSTLLLPVYSPSPSNLSSFSPSFLPLPHPLLFSALPALHYRVRLPLRTWHISCNPLQFLPFSCSISSTSHTSTHTLLHTHTHIYTLSLSLSPSLSPQSSPSNLQPVCFP